MGTKKEKDEKNRKKIEEIQSEIKLICQKIGWFQNRMGKRLYYEINDADNLVEENKFVEKFKKDLNRSSKTDSKLKELKEYQRLIHIIPEVQKSEFILPLNYLEKDDSFDSDFYEKMRGISRCLDEKLTEKEQIKKEKEIMEEEKDFI